MQRTMFDGMLPSLETVMQYHFASSAVAFLRDPGFTIDCCMSAKAYFTAAGYKSQLFHLCNDAVRLRPEVSWDQATDSVVGLCTLEQQRCPQTLTELSVLVAKHRIATEADVLVLCPLDPALPGFVVGIFPQTGNQKTSMHLQRRDVICNQLAALGMYVVSHGADGDAAQLSAMKQRAYKELRNLDPTRPGCALFIELANIPQLDEQLGSLQCPAQLAKLNTNNGGPPVDVLLPELYGQDTCHLASKLRGRVTNRGGRSLHLGDGIVDINLLRNLCCNSTSAATLGLQQFDFEHKRDPMNVTAFFRLTSDTVLFYLRDCVERGFEPEQHGEPQPSALHLLLFLTMARRAVDAILSPKLELLERVECAWYSSFFVQLWLLHARSQLTKKPASNSVVNNSAPADGIDAALVSSSKKKAKLSCWTHMVTPNQYDCIIMNANCLLLALHFFSGQVGMEGATDIATQLLGSSQPVEDIFRATRSCFSGNDPNYTLAGLLLRTSYVHMGAMVHHRRADQFVWPRHRKHPNFECLRRCGQSLAGVTTEQLLDAVSRALELVKQDFKLVGIDAASLVVNSTIQFNVPIGVAACSDEDDDNKDEEDEEEPLRSKPQAGATGNDDGDASEVDGCEEDMKADALAATWMEQSAAAAAAEAAKERSEEDEEDVFYMPTDAELESLARSASGPTLPCSGTSTRPPSSSNLFFTPLPPPSKPVLPYLLDGLKNPLDKRTAMAYVSQHPKVSTARLSRYIKYPRVAINHTDAPSDVHQKPGKYSLLRLHLYLALQSSAHDSFPLSFSYRGRGHNSCNSCSGPTSQATDACCEPGKQ